MGEAPGTVLPMHSSSSSVNMWNSRNKLSSPNIQCWDRPMLTVLDTSIQKGRKWKEKRSHQSHTISKSSWANSIKFQGLSIILCGSQFCPLGSWLHSLNYPSFFMKGSMCLQISRFISLFPASRTLGGPKVSFHLSFHPLSIPFRSS